MKKIILTDIKGIAEKRAKQFKNLGIDTVEKLADLDFSKLSEIRGVGKYNAKIIHASLQNLHETLRANAEPEQKKGTNEAVVILSAESKTKKLDKDLQIKKFKKAAKSLKKSLSVVEEKLKPITAKKYRSDYLCLKESILKQEKVIRNLGKILNKKKPKAIKTTRRILKDEISFLKAFDVKKKHAVYKKLTSEIRAVTRSLKKR